MTPRGTAYCVGRACRSVGRRWIWAATALIVMAGIAAYSNSLRGPFIFDDPLSIAKNPTIRSLGRLGDVLLPSPQLHLYRPTLNLTLAVCYAVGGLDVVAYHVVNLAIHILAALVLFGVIRRTLLLPALADRFGAASTGLGLAVSLLWMLHPLQTESVTYVVQRCEALLGLFCLLTVYCVLRGASSARAWRWHLAAVAACGLGMGAKESMAMTPFLVLLYDRVFLASSLREVFRKRWGLYLGMALTGVILVSMIEASLTRGFGTVGKVPTVGEYARTQFGVVVHYLRLSFWLAPLCLDYGWPVANSAWEIIPPAAAIGVLFLTTCLAFWRWPRWGFLGVCFFLTLAPSSSVFPIPDLAFEHRMYLPLAPLVAAVVLAGYAAGRRWMDRGVFPPLAVSLLGFGLIVAIVSVLAALTYRRNNDYRSELAIWQATLTQAPHNPRVHLSLGVALAHQGRDADAVAHFRQALKLDSRNVTAYHNLGSALAALGKTSDAIEQFEQALKLDAKDPEIHYNFAEVLIQAGRLDEAIAHYRRALEITPNDSRIFNNLGDALVRQGRFDEAITEFRQALAIDPNAAGVHGNVGNVLAGQQRFREAMWHYQQALRINPDSAETHHRLATLWLAQGQTEPALAHWREAVRLQPDSVPLLLQVAWVLATSPEAAVRNGGHAVALAERAARLVGTPTPAVLDVLAAAYAEAGRFPEAAQTVQQALALLPEQTNAAAADALRSRLKLYQAGAAFRESKPAEGGPRDHPP